MKYYTNPQMLSRDELHEAHLEKAKKYLESKWDGYYYEVYPRTDENIADDVIADENMGFEDFESVEDDAPHELYQQGIYYLKLTNKQFSEKENIAYEYTRL